ncbi:hypothetical protein BH18ACI4_BH18ACI4_02940 [soil metagenome]
MDYEENSRALAHGKSGLRRMGLVVGGLGLEALLTYLLSKALGARQKTSLPRNFPDQPVDDRGTGQDEAAQMLRNLRDRAFEASDERLALALGRPREEVAAWYAGREVIDDDVVMKARGIAMNRGVRIE